jgi:hypothetical protein
MPPQHALPFWGGRVARTAFQSVADRRRLDPGILTGPPQGRNPRGRRAALFLDCNERKLIGAELTVLTRDNPVCRV